MNEPHPYVVEVKHHPNAKKTYCFAVPACFAFNILPGTLLEVDTCKGKTLATAVSRATCDPGKMKEMMARTGAREPLRPVTAVQGWANPRSIDIPAHFLMAPPSHGKLRLREQEYRQDGAFHTRIEVTHIWHTLRDGYSAYVAAKRLGLAAIPVWIVEESEEGKDAYCRAID